MGTAGIGAAEDYSIYSVPQFSMINKAWLDELGLPVPTMLEELHTALKAFKSEHHGHHFFPLKISPRHAQIKAEPVIAAQFPVRPENQMSVVIKAVQEEAVVCKLLTGRL